MWGISGYVDLIVHYYDEAGISLCTSHKTVKTRRRKIIRFGLKGWNISDRRTCPACKRLYQLTECTGEPRHACEARDLPEGKTTPSKPSPSFS